MCYHVTKSSIHVNYEGIACVPSIDTYIVELMSVTLKEKPTVQMLRLVLHRLKQTRATQFCHVVILEEKANYSQMLRLILH